MTDLSLSPARVAPWARSRAPLILLVQKETVPHYRVSVYNYLSDQLRASGLTLRVVAEALESSNPHPLRFEFASFELRVLPLLRYLCVSRPRSVIVYMSLKEPVVWPLLLYGRIAGCPMINWRHAIDLSQPGNRTKNALYALLNALATRLIVFSEDEKMRLPASQRWKASVANNTLNFRDMPVVTEAKDELKKRWGIPFQKVVLFSGRVQVRKRIMHLLRAFEDPSFINHGLLVMGPGMSRELHDWASEHPNVVLLGAQYDPQKVAEIFKMADVFCIPGSVGLSINQAFYWGLPIVTEVAHHGPEICYLRHGKNGFMTRDEHDLRSRLLDLLEDDELRHSMSRCARDTILQEAGIETMIKGFLDAIRVVGARPSWCCDASLPDRRGV